ncbi:MAG: DUF5717 family protein [Lachnospiraceae bacterium]|nr:DUF5717 family protein [Lachnospiraceae bacterium]
MREIIDKLVDGVFEYDTDKLLFDVQSIEVKLSTKEIHEGTIHITSEENTPVKGFIYSSNMRFVVRETEFNTNDFIVEYIFDPTGLEAGDVVKGDVQIVSSAGEYYLPFEFTILSAAKDSKVSGVRNLFHFTNLAQTDFTEATQIFYTPDFVRVFDGNDKSNLTKYRGFSNNKGDRQSVEDFLCSINKKKPVELIVEKNVFEFSEVTTKLRCELLVRKSNWGFIEAKISTDVDFIVLEKEYIHNEDFNSPEYKLVFTIDDDKLHEGRNYGTIKVSNKNNDITITIIAMQRGGDKAKRAVRKESKLLQYRLMNCYVRFRTKQMNTNGWVRESMKVVERMNLLDDKNPISRLFQAQLLLVENRVSEAKWILEHVFNEMKIIEHDDECYAYYLYLTTLIKREDQYVDDVTARIASYYSLYPTSMPLLWMLIYLDEELSGSATKKLSAIEQITKMGVHSPILFVEAYNVYVANPQIISKLSPFEIEVLNFAVKNGKISGEIIGQVSMLALRQREFSKRLLDLLINIYGLYNDPEIVEAICTMLIRADVTDNVYHKWYREGVKLELKITKLYEYFIYSSSLKLEEGALPKSVIMYFGFQNRLDYERKAYIYANLIKYKNRMPDLYESNRENILVFAIEQVMDNHISEHLAMIYEDILLPEFIKPNMANNLSSIIFARMIRTDNRKYKNLIVVCDEFVDEFVYPIDDGRAYPRIYTKNVSLFYEDEAGKRTYVETEEAKHIINENNYIHIIKRYVTGNLPFFLYLCEGKRQYISVEEENADFCRDLVEAESISASLKSEIRMSLLHYYFDRDRISTLDEFLLNINVAELTSRERGELIDFYVKRAMYDQAYDLITVYGDELISAKSLVKVCSHMIEKTDGVRDVMLTAIAYSAFKNGKYDGNTIDYLVNNYGGLTKELRDLWRAAKSFDTQCYVLTEKLIIQMLFTRTTVGEKEYIFEDYVSSGASPRVEMAYLSYAAYDYFVKERITDKSIFTKIVDNYRQGEPLNDGCKLAILKYYTDNEKEITERIKDMIIEFIQEFLHKNVYFKFFSEYVEIVPELAAFQSALFIEYRTNPKARVVLHYILDDDEDDTYKTEEMRNMFGGIFSKEFMLFFGERLQYYVTEEVGGREVLTLSDSVSIDETVNDGVDSRYNILNSMVVAKTLRDEATLIDLMEEYAMEDAFTERVFNVV